VCKGLSGINVKIEKKGVDMKRKLVYECYDEILDCDIRIPITSDDNGEWISDESVVQEVENRHRRDISQFVENQITAREDAAIEAYWDNKFMRMREGD